MFDKTKIDNLKKSFSSGQIPTEENFKDIINLADEANKLLNITADDTVKLNGLTTGNDKHLSVDLASKSGLDISSGLAIKPGPGVTVDTNGVSINAGPGLRLDDNVLKVNASAEIDVTPDGLKIKTGKGLKTSSEGLEIQYGDGLKVDGAEINVKIKDKSGIIIDSVGLGLNVAVGADDTSGTDNNLKIGTDGKLTLTKNAIDLLKEGSKNKFVNALTAAKTYADSQKITLSEVPKKENISLWEKPIETWIDDANKFGEGRIERAKKFFESNDGIKKLINSYSINPHKIHFNFSGVNHDKIFYSEHDIFSFVDLLWMDENSVKNKPDSPDPKIIDGQFFKTNLFYTFIGRFIKHDSIDYVSDSVTSNAVMVYITKEQTYVIGYWDLTTAIPTWYLGETDPRDNTRIDKALGDAKANLAKDENGKVILSDIKSKDAEAWDVPITKLLKEANSYNNSELYRAKLLLPEFLKKQDYIKGITYDKPALNFTFGHNDPAHKDFLFVGSKNTDYFLSQEVYAYHFSANAWSDVSDIKISVSKVQDYSSSLKEGFFAVIGKLNKDNIDSSTGEFITCNAIMYHINSASAVSVVGYFDLTKADFDFYPVEADPHYNDITRKPEDLKLTPPSTIYADTKEVTLVPTGVNGGKITYSSKNSDILDVEKDTGKLIPKKWSDTAVVITASQAATRTKNACSATLDITVTPKIPTPLADLTFENFKLIDRVEGLKKISNQFKTLVGNPGIPINLKTSSPGVTFTSPVVDDKLEIIANSAESVLITATQEGNSIYKLQSKPYSFEILENLKNNNLDFVIFKYGNSFNTQTNECSIIGEFGNFTKNLNNSKDILFSCDLINYTHSFSLKVEDIKSALLSNGIIKIHNIIDRTIYNKIAYLGNIKVEISVHQDADGKIESHDMKFHQEFRSLAE